MKKKLVEWSPPSVGPLSLMWMELLGAKSGPTGIEGVLRDHAGSISVVFSEAVGIMESNEAELLSIQRALALCASFG